jgi:hypothetical protein
MMDKYLLMESQEGHINRFPSSMRSGSIRMRPKTSTEEDVYGICSDITAGYATDLLTKIQMAIETVLK